jgi:hypothetical protein
MIGGAAGRLRRDLGVGRILVEIGRGVVASGGREGHRGLRLAGAGRGVALIDGVDLEAGCLRPGVLGDDAFERVAGGGSGGNRAGWTTRVAVTRAGAPGK